MKLNPSPNGQLCSLETTGTFVHMVWDCPGVRDFWSMVSNRMSIVLERTIPCSPTILLLKDFTGLDHSSTRKVRVDECCVLSHLCMCNCLMSNVVLFAFMSYWCCLICVYVKCCMLSYLCKCLTVFYTSICLLYKS